MKILHCCLASFYIDNYGYQENIFPVLHKKDGHDVYIIASTETYIENKTLGYIQSSSYTTSDNIPISRISYSKLLPHAIARKLRLYVGLSGIIRNIKPDLIFLHDVQFISVIEIANYARKSSVIIYADSHTDFINSGKNWFSKNILHRIIYKFCVKIIEPYTKMFFGTLPLRVDFLRDVYGVSQEKLDLLPFGADETQYNSNNTSKVRRQIREQYFIDQKDFLIVTGGKIDRRKNIHFLMEAFSSIGNARVKLIIFGAISDELEREISILSENQNITLIGWVSVKKSYELLLASDLGVFPGTHSILWEQAIGVGLPCIFKRWPGIEHLDVGGNCLLIEDVSPDSLLESIKRLYKDTSMYKKMKDASIRFGVPKFSYSKIAKHAIGLNEGNDVSC